MAKYLGRNLAIPPIIQHYMQRKGGGLKSWLFSEIFKYNGVVDLEDSLIEEAKSQYKFMTYTDFRSNIKWKTLLDQKQSLSPPRRIKSHIAYDMMKTDENVIILSGLFNNTAISECFANGCDDCPLNPHFEKDYIEICQKFDFSDKIKTWGEQFLSENGLENFIAVHIRFDDGGKESFDDKKLYEYIRSKTDLPIFIATNKQKKLTITDIKLLPSKEEYDELESFIEQYICTKAVKFYYNGGGLAKPCHKHLRSTWTSFVTDYRKFVLENNDNFYLSHLKDY